MQKKIARIVGLVGTLACLAIFIHEPSFPTPDKLLVFATLVAMIFGQAWQVLKRLVPFVAILLIYESFRGLVPHLNGHVNYTFLINADKFLFFGHLPTAVLQRVMWHGHVQWYDFLFYIVYMLHFVLPFSLALLIWKTREKYYWRYVTTFLVTSFGGFLTFLFFPAAPPWLAAQNGYILAITRISSSVLYALGIHDFPSVYNKISPNPVAAMPSLHAAYATLFLIFVYKLYGKKWALLATIYPICIYLGTVYQGEHYAIDEIAGILYAVGGYFLVPYIWKLYKSKQKRQTAKSTD